jgi:hypothetical protein
VNRSPGSFVGACMHRRQLPLAFECPRSIDEMPTRADGRQRWCDDCRRVVHDLSLYGEVEAREMLRKKAAESVCVTYRFDERGAVQFRRTMLDRLGVALASAALLASAGCIGFAEMEIESQEPDVEQRTWVVTPARELKPKPPPSTPAPEVETFDLPLIDLELTIDDFGMSRGRMGGIVSRSVLNPEELDRHMGFSTIVEQAASQ